MQQEGNDTRQRARWRLGIKLRFQLIICGLVVISTVMLAFIAILSLKKSNSDAKARIRTALVNRYEAEVKHQVQTMVDVVENHVKNGFAMKVSIEQLRTEVRDMVREARFDYFLDPESRRRRFNGYFFVYEKGGVCKVHGSKREREDRNWWDDKDPDGVRVIQELEKAALNGGGIVRYKWDKPGKSMRRVPKIGYAQELPSLGWWIGTGVYVEDVEKVIGAATRQQARDLHVLIVRFGVLVGVMVGAGLILGLIFGAHITRPITALVDAVQRLADGNFETRVAVRSHDELRVLGDAINTMAEHVSDAIQAIEMEERIKARLFESVADGLVVTNRENHIIQVNPAAERIFNYAPGELIGLPLDVLLPDELRRDYEQSTLNQVNRGQTVVNYNVRRIRKTGENVYLTVAVAPIFDDSGEVIQRIHSVTDMTEHRTLLDQLERADRLRKFLPTQTHGDAGAENGRQAYERRRMTVFFSHVSGLCSLSSELEPEDLTKLLTEFLTAMNEVIYRFGGTLDKFLGEGQMGFFGAPESNGEEEDAKRCVQMALAMQAELKRLNQQWRLRSPLALTVGINTGYMTLGNFGSDFHLDNTVVGIPVLVAQRLSQCGEAESVLITHETRRLLASEFRVQPRNPISLEGCARSVDVFLVEPTT